MIKLAGQNEFHKYRLPVKEFIVNVVLSFGFFGGAKRKIVEREKQMKKQDYFTTRILLIMPIFAPSTDMYRPLRWQTLTTDLLNDVAPVYGASINFSSRLIYDRRRCMAKVTK